MNQANNAQAKKTGTIFFILIPVFIFLFAFVYDIGLVWFQEVRVKKATEEVVTLVLLSNTKEYYTRVKELYEERDVTTNLLEVKYENDTLIVYNSHTYPSFFGRILGVNTYRYEVSVKATLNGEEVTIEEAPIE